MKEWLTEIGVKRNLEFVEIPEHERAHYSKRTIDIEYKYPFGQKELYGLAYRGDFDLSQHQKLSGQSLEYTDPKTGEKFIPHVIEPTWGVDRSLLVVLLEAYHEESDRVVLKLPPKLAPYKAAVFPLLANKPQLVEKARAIYDDLRNHFSVAWDDRGNVGKRYYSQDEIGTPFCITVDFDTLENGTVTVRDRDTKQQPRVKIEELRQYINSLIS
jgi:glycyl-tRNA synthetase